MQFEKDIFISYAHLDDQPLPRSKEGWVSTFADTLEHFVHDYLGRKVQVWRDPRLESNTIFDNEIVENLLKSAILVAVLSPRYVKSPWCVKEATQFWQTAKQADLDCVGNASRIFRVEKVPVDAYPPELHFLKDQLGKPFFDKDPSRGKFYELRIEFDEQQFYQRVCDLAQEIAGLLNALDVYSCGSTAAALPYTSGTLNLTASELGLNSTERSDIPFEKTVYLAHTTSDLQESRASIRRELEARGYLILPQSSPSASLKTFAEQVKIDLARSRLSIHLIGETYGFIPENSTHSIIDIQNLLAIERNKDAPLPRLVWLRPGLLNITDKRHQKLIQYLQQDAQSQRNADVLQLPLEELKTIILHQLNQPIAQPPTARSSGELCQSGTAQTAENSIYPWCIYLDYDQQDINNPETRAELNQLHSYLKETCQAVYTPKRENVISSFVDSSLKQCDGILIYHGLGDRKWIEGRWKAAFKSLGYALSSVEQKQPKVRYIYVGSPQTPLKEALKEQKLPIIRGEGAFSPERLKPFFEQLKLSSHLEK